MIYIRSIIFNILFFTITAFFTLLATIALIFPKKASIKISYWWSFTILTLLKYICQITYNVKGQENIPQNQNVIFASKHQSAWETVAYQYILKNCVFMFKKELTFIPLFGLTLLKAGNIVVDRGNATKTTLQKLNTKFNDRLKTRNIIIFPEGTRTKPNTKVKYKSGLSIITQTMQNKWVVPIAINSGLFWPKHGFLKHKGTIEVHILPPIPTGKLSKEQFQEILINEIENEEKIICHSDQYI
ncbi:1-acyl-sn-glycerol-3-phosphate acyltransferase [bacterium]|nr:1-acyl-sn-glycerol-3-phosphate acyltransferase [bacterium]